MPRLAFCGSDVAWDDPGPALETVDGWVCLRFLLVRSGSAFAGIHDRAVVTYGDPEAGGDSGSVQHLLINVHRIRGCERSFAAILPSYRLLALCEHSTCGRGLRAKQQPRTTLAHPRP